MTWSTRRPAAWRNDEPEQLGERLVAGRPQPPRDERWEAPVLAVGVELVGRRADPHAGGEQVLPQPGVGAVGSGADGEVVDEPDAGRGGRRGGVLAVAQPLQPGVEGDDVGVLGGEAGDGGGRRAGRCSAGQSRQPVPWCSARAQKVA